jgi:hypothetical protein
MKISQRNYHCVTFLDPVYSCSSTSLQGVCVPYKECSFTKAIDGFLNAEIFQNIKTRSDACHELGKNFICCEESTVTEKSTTQVAEPTTISTEAPQSIVEETVAPSTDVDAPSRISGPFMVSSHPNYDKFFENIRCGSSSSVRIANGAGQKQRLTRN